MSRTPLALSLALVALAATPRPAAAESPIIGSAEFTVGGYRPNIDGPLSPQNGAPPPYAASFGGGRPLAFKLHVGRALPWRQYGTVELGGGVGYWGVKGHATDAAGNPTADKTALKIIPLEVSATYRADVLWERWRVPFVPYGRLGFQHYAWWTTGQTGSTSQSGGTNGWSIGGGVGFVLDLIDPMLAREFDADSGVNHTILIFDVTKAKVNDFGRKNSAGEPTSLDLSDSQGVTYSLGLLFVF